MEDKRDSRLNKRTLSFLIAIILIVTTIGTDAFMVQANSEGEMPVVTVGEEQAAPEEIEAAEDVTPVEVAAGEETPNVIEEIEATEQPAGTNGGIEEVSNPDGEERVGAGNNVTALAEQLGLTLTLLQHGKDGNWQNISFSGTDIDLSSIDLADEFKMQITFSLLQGVGDETYPPSYKQIADRTIREGDYFIIQLPESFAVNEDKSGPLKSADNTVTYANYTIDKATRLMKVTFTDAVNKESEIYDIVGDAFFEFKLDINHLKEDQNATADVTLGTTDYTFKLPKKEATPGVKGVQKSTVSINKDTREITWKIRVGTDSKSAGLSLNGVIVEDTLPKDLLNTTKGVTYSVSGGTAQTAVLDSNGKFSYTFPESPVYYAPAEIEVKAFLKDEIFTGELTQDTGATPGTLSDVTVTNKVSMKISENATPETAATSDTIKRNMLDKNGDQLSATDTQWKITVNKDLNHVYSAVVTDILDSNLDLKGEISVNGVAYPVETSNDTSKSICITKVGQTIKIYFNSPFSDKKEIVFNTTINSSGGLATQDKVTNSASIEWKIPNGNGEGPGHSDWGIPGIEVNYNRIYVTKDVSFDKSTGDITWTIHPSSRYTANTNVWLEDTIASDQTFVAGSLSVKRSGSEVTGLQSKNADFDGAANNKIYISEASDNSMSDADINNTVVTYKTHAKYWGDNLSNHTYANTVSFKANGSTAEDNASTTPTNNVLKKSAVKVWDNDAVNKNQMEYTITLNSEQMNLSKAGTDLIITDDVSNLFMLDGSAESRYQIVLDKFAVYKGNDKMGMTLAAADTAPTTAQASYDGTNIKINLGDNAGSNTYTIKIYAAIDNEVFENDFTKLSTVNRATASGGNLYGEISAETTSNQDNEIGNKLAQKTAKSFDSNTGELKWEVVVDSREAGITRPLTIIDTLAPGVNAEFDADSVKVYRTKHNDKGEIDGVESGEPLTEGITSSISLNEAGGSSLIITITNTTPDAYTICYSTIVTGALNTLTNHATVIANGEEKSSDTKSYNVNMQGAASGSVRASLQVEKTDALDGAVVVPGAKFGLYRNATDTTPILTATTDAEGKLKFGALKAEQDFFIKEIKAAPGYVLPSPNEMIPVRTGAARTVSTTQVTNNRKSANVKITKINEDNEKLSGAKFKLYYVKADNTVSGVKLNGTAFDSYQVSGNATEVEVGATGILELTGIPTGSYYLVETASPVGYSTPAADVLHKFEVENDGDGTKVTYGENFKSGTTNGEIVNLKEVIRIHKVDSEDTTLGLTGAKFQIEKLSGASWLAQGSEFTMTSDTFGVGDAALDYGHTYRIIEKQAPDGYLTPSENAIVAQFSLDGNGQITVVSGNFAAATKTFTVKNDAAYADVKLMKKDSLGKLLSGVKFSLYKKKGDTPDTSVDTLIESGLSTSADGIQEKTHLKGGKYYFVETATVSTCVLDSTPIEFAVDESSNGKTLMLDMVNQVTTVNFDKTNKKGDLLAGAVMQITDASGNVVKEFTTSGSTDVISDICVCGETYTITEIKAPKGYKKAKSITFTINAQGRVVIDGVVQDGNVIKMVDNKVTITTDDNGTDEPTEDTKTPTKTPTTTTTTTTTKTVTNNHDGMTDVEYYNSLGAVFGPEKNMTYSQYLAFVLGQSGAPNTGDDTPWALYVMMMLGALLTGGGAFWLIRKDEKKAE